MHESHLSIFSRYAINPSPASALPLKDHLQLQSMLDILSRQQKHHLFITNCAAQKIQLAIIASLQQRLLAEAVPKTLQNAHIIYFDTARFALSTENHEEIENDFHALYAGAHAKQQKIIFIINQIESLFNQDSPSPMGHLGKLLTSVAADDQWRLVFLTANASTLPFHLAGLFTHLAFTEPTQNEKIAVLKSSRAELEEFHQVTLLDELFPTALSLAKHYMPEGTSIDSALELLDSAAARASMDTHNKPVVTNNHLASVLTSWTQVPLEKLQKSTFQINKFVETIQQRIFGHDTAIQAIGSLLQTASLKLHPKPGPYCSFLFTGPACAGKTSLAEAIADYFYGEKNALVRVNLSSLACTLNQLTATIDHNCLDLLTAVAQKPYAVLLLENIDQCRPEFLERLQYLFSYGYALNALNKKINFSHTIVIMTTTLGTDRILHLTHTSPEKNKTMDLLQLVLNESVRDITYASSQQLSLSELRDEVLETLTAHFSADFLQHVHTIPFVALDYLSLEKIMHKKIKMLTKQLLARFNIELTYAAEVINYLAHEALWQRSKIRSLDIWLDQQLYARIAHEILRQTEKSERPTQLLIQLNESGQSLRCEFISCHEAQLVDISQPT